jgi:UDP-glucuronate 4-epimerase
VCEALLRQGRRVIAFDNFDDFYDPAAKRGHVAELLDHRDFELIEGDIRDARAVQRAVSRGVEAVIHLAARAGVRPSIEQPLLYEDVNVKGTLTLLEACRRAAGLRFLFGSSSSVYGNNAKAPFSESDRVDAPISPYAATKLAGELLCRTYVHLYDMNITCLRFFTVYGPRQRPDLAIHKFVRLLEAGEPLPVFGDGTMSRDYTYVDDIVAGVVRAEEMCRGFHLYNLGGSHPVTLTELIAQLERATGREARLDRRPPQPGDVEHTYADITLAGKELGFHPATELVVGLSRFVDWFRGEPARCESAAAWAASLPHS